MTYAEKLKDPRWQKKRLEVMQRDGFKCQMCGDTEQTLHVHHENYRKGAKPWDYELHELRCFCEDCHEKVEMNIGIARTICCEIDVHHLFVILWHIRLAYSRASAIGANNMVVETLSTALRSELARSIVGEVKMALLASDTINWKQLEEEVIDVIAAKGDR